MSDEHVAPSNKTVDPSNDQVSPPAQQPDPARPLRERNEMAWRAVCDQRGAYVHLPNDSRYPGDTNWSAPACTAGVHPLCLQPDPAKCHDRPLCHPDWCGSSPYSAGQHAPMSKHVPARQPDPDRNHNMRRALAGDPPARPEGTRVVLVKPGDVLVIGNLGAGFMPELLTKATQMMKAATGVSILACYQDVSIATTSADLAAVLDYCRTRSAEALIDEAGAYDDVAERIERALKRAEPEQPVAMHHRPDCRCDWCGN